ncbi:MAG TPA: response regulator, partial [Alphaproteobacteria bacterium]|nr:response regulator [Alphaproteobacteria bacterium]
PVLVTPKPRWDPYGRLYGTGAVVRDAREQAEGPVEPEVLPPSAEARFTRLFADAPVGIALIEKSGLIVEANRTFSQITGVPAADIAGRNFGELLDDEDRAAAAEGLAVAFDVQAAPSVMDVTFRNGQERVAQMIARGLDDDGAGEPAAIVYLLDVTEQKNLELRFAQSQKMDAVGQLAGGVAHDFNNLLTAIMGFTDLLLSRHGPGDPSFADIMQIQQNSKRATNLVRQLLAFSRQQTLHPKVLDVTDAIAELSHLLRRLLGATIELKVIHGRDLGYVKVDQGQLEQVITNLAVNARDAMTEGGTLTIRTANVSAAESIRLGHDLMPPADYVMIEVSDTGTGMPREVLGQIFEPFFTTKEVGKGTGLGLSTVYGIVKQTGGFIFPESELGKGTSFKLYLPVYVETEAEYASAIADRKDGRAQEALPVKDLTGKAKVLLVEDEDAVRMFASRALQSKGYTVYEAESGVKALELLDGEGIDVDLIVSDVVMPQMDGPTLINRLRERDKQPKIIFISGYAEDAFRKNLDAKNVNFLPKPFSLKQLAEKVKDVLET